MENKILAFKKQIKEKDDENKRLLDDQKARRGQQQEQLMRSLSQLEDCYERGQYVLNTDLDKLEKSVKLIRRAKRHLRSKQVTNLRNAELEMEDIMSSSDEHVDNPEGNKFPEISMIEKDPSEEPKTARGGSNKSGEEEKECNLPRMALGGVPINENGEPIQNNVSQEWISEFDETNSQVYLIIKQNCRTAAGFWSFVKIMKHIKMQKTQYKKV